MVGLPSNGLQKRVLAILVESEGGVGMYSVLSRRISHFGFLNSRFLARSFVENLNYFWLCQTICDDRGFKDCVQCLADLS